MNIVVPKKEILRLVERCHGVADKKSAVPALANVLLTAERGSLRVAATDLYMGMAGSCEAEIAEPGARALPAKDLFERLRAMPEGPVQIVTGDNVQTIVKAVGGARRYTMHGLSGNDFPKLPAASPDADVLDMPAELLALLMARTHFSISADETRAHVNSLLLEWHGGRVRAVSTDGHRLTMMSAERGNAGPNVTALVSLRAIGELRRFVEGAKNMIEIRREGPNAFFTVAGMTFSAKLIDAQFPPWEQVVPRDLAASARVNRILFADAVKAVQLAAADRTGGISLVLAGDALHVTAASPESGDGSDEVPAVYGGAERKIGVNSKYILDVLTSLDCDEVDMIVTGELDPMLLRPADAKPDEYVACIMPMRI